MAALAVPFYAWLFWKGASNWGLLHHAFMWTPAIAALIVVGSLVALNSVNLSLNLANTFSTVAGNL